MIAGVDRERDANTRTPAGGRVTLIFAGALVPPGVEPSARFRLPPSGWYSAGCESDEIKSARTMKKLTISKLADAAGTHLETVRYYERIGLMPEPERSEGGHRHYAPAHLQRLKFIRRARD